MAKDPDRSKLLFLDLETTSLVPTEAVLEIGIRVTTPRLETVEDWSVVIHQDAKLTQMPPVVRDMHTRSGLLADVAASKFGETAAFEAAASIARAHFPGGSALLCGFSIPFDRGYIRAQMPKLERMLHRRMIDVSAIIEAQCVCYGLAWPEIGTKEVAHRSLADVDASVKMLRLALGWCRECPTPLDPETDGRLCVACGEKASFQEAFDI